jgi:hypothetical protein
MWPAAAPACQRRRLARTSRERQRNPDPHEADKRD